MREIIWRPRAAIDLESILTYIAVELGAPRAARSCAQAILDAIERIADLPESGRLFTDDDLKRPYRRVLVKAYWIYYTYDSNSLTVWRIFHTTQDHDAFGFELLD